MKTSASRQHDPTREGSVNAFPGPSARADRDSAEEVTCLDLPLHRMTAESRPAAATTGEALEQRGGRPARLESDLMIDRAPQDGSVARSIGGEDWDEFGVLSPLPNPLRHPLKATGWLIRTSFAMLCVVLFLAVIAAIPIVNFLALGYLLEATGRVARTGKLRYAMPLATVAPRIGMITLGVWVCVLPLRVLSSLSYQGQVIADVVGEPSVAATQLGTVTGLAAIVVSVHLCLALARGGTLGCFLRPIKNGIWFVRRWRAGGYFSEAAGHAREFVRGMRLRHHFWLGLRGFLGAQAWLVLPTALYAAARRTEGGPVLLSLLGGVLLVVVFCWVPFLQARFATEQRFRSMFELKAVRDLFRHAPLAWMLAVLALYLLALPLYLGKVRLPPADAMWLLTIIFIVSIYPTKVVLGWAYGRALRRSTPARWQFRWLARLVIVPWITFYVILLFFTQFIGEHGKLGLFEHHAFLLPVPF